jgi:peptidoglycan/LPS O-acetylase OafA/YrhL
MVRNARIEYIDAFRALAVLSVVLFHYTDRLPWSVMGYDNPILPGLWSWGWIGPYWFFIVSGYFMAGSIGNTSSPVEFLAKRLSRIYPAYFFALLIIIAVKLVVPPLTYEAWDYSSALPSALDIAGNFFFATDLGLEFVDGAFWTLVVELKFYLFLALLYFVCYRGDLSKTIDLFTYLSIPLGCAWLVLNVGSSPIAGMSGPLSLANSILQTVAIAIYLPFFALGLVAARFFRETRSTDVPKLLALTLLTSSIVFVFSGHKQYEYENSYLTVTVYVAVCVFFFFLVVQRSKLSNHGPAAKLILGILARIGFVSYAWYLVHQDLGMLAIYHLNAYLPGWLSLVLALVGTYLLGEALGAFAEWRFRKPVERAFAYVGSFIFPWGNNRQPAVAVDEQSNR